VRLSDITVEVRDRSLTRLGLIRPEDLDLTIDEAHNNVGTWTVKLPTEHPLAVALRQPGAGIIVTGPTGVLMSGPTIKPELAASVADPAGTVTVEGVTDSVLLADALAYPQPGNGDPETQTLAHDTRTGPVETLLHAFVNANIGPAAPPVRRGAGLPGALTMGANLGRGPVTTKSARFAVLGNLLAELASVADLGFRIVQRGDVLVFETYPVHDHTADVRLDIYNNTLSSHRTALAAPGATQVIVAGQQEGVDRQFLHLSTADSTTAQQQWGRRIERFVDQRNTSDVAELTQAGMEVLTQQGVTAIAVQARPMDDTTMTFGTDWGLGDRVAVVVAGQELAATVTGYAVKTDADGFRLGALIGDPTALNPGAATARAAATVETRVAALERTTPATASDWRYAVTYLEPYVGYDDEGPRYSVAGNEVRLRGYFWFADDAPQPQPGGSRFIYLASLPPALTPAEIQNFPVACGGPNYVAQIEVGTGWLGIYLLPGGLPGWVAIDGIRYLLT